MEVLKRFGGAFDLYGSYRLPGYRRASSMRRLYLLYLFGFHIKILLEVLSLISLFAMDYLSIGVVLNWTDCEWDYRFHIVRNELAVPKIKEGA